MNCQYCNIVEGKEPAAILYEDNELLVVVRDSVITPGQITVFSRQHYPTLETVPDEILQRAAVLANKVSIAVFESLGSKGTNILIKNGLGAGQNIPHFGLEIIPRQDGDNLNLQWPARQLAEEEMDTTYLILKEEIGSLLNIGKQKVEEPKQQIVAEQVKEEKGKENYLLKSVR